MHKLAHFDPEIDEHVIPEGDVVSNDHLLSQYMFKTGCIRVKGDSEPEKPTETECMFDSGALTTSYVDIRFLTKHPHLLAKIQPKKTKVVLGDGNGAKAIMCDGVIHMDLEFTDDSNGSHIQDNQRSIHNNADSQRRHYYRFTAHRA